MTLKNEAYWVALWHIYQPPVQTKEWLIKVTDESYRQIISLYSEIPDSKFTLNINGSLTTLLIDNELWDVIEGFKTLADNGQLEFVSTLSFHGICPLLPEKEIIRQIKLNDRINRKAFGKSYKPKGVWLPEMAYSPDIIPAIKKAGYEWVPLAGVASNGKWSNEGYFIVRNGKFNLKVVFRDDVVSLNLGFGDSGRFVNELSKSIRKGTFCFTALDGETIGHHVKGLVEDMRLTLNMISKKDGIRTLTLGEVFKKFKCLGEVDAFSSSWSTTYDDIKSGNYFPLWLEKHQEPFKTVHRLAWEHLYLLINTSDYVENNLNGNLKKTQFIKARELVDRGEYSCMYWWFTRDQWHRVSARFLMGLEMQARAFDRLLQASNNDRKVRESIEKAHHIRDKIYKELNNFYYSTE